MFYLVSFDIPIFDFKYQRYRVLLFLLKIKPKQTNTNNQRRNLIYFFPRVINKNQTHTHTHTLTYAKHLFRTYTDNRIKSGHPNNYNNLGNWLEKNKNQDSSDDDAYPL